jgi:hypothetical protein
MILGKLAGTIGSTKYETEDTMSNPANPRPTISFTPQGLRS